MSHSLSNARSIRGSRGGNVPIERCRRAAEPLRDLTYGDVGISEHRLGSLDVVVREFRRTASGAATSTEPSAPSVTPLPLRPADVRSERAVQWKMTRPLVERVVLVLTSDEKRYYVSS
jgi:hypothetical protein